jgi:hypothetical protein
MKTLFANRTGHILALLNVALISAADLGYLDLEIMRRVVFYLNWPSIGLERYVLDIRIAGLLFPLIMYAQWLVIGWIACDVATRLKRMDIRPA